MFRALGKVVRRVWADSAIRFLLVGAVLFGVQAVAKPKPRQKEPEAIVVTRAQVDELLRERKRLGEVTVDVDRVVGQYVEDELLWREGKKLGLDAQDPIVRRRIIQKMTFLAEDSVGTQDPGDRALRQFFDQHAAEFTLPVRVTFRQVFFSRQRRGDRAEKDARETLRKLDASPPADGESALGDPAITGSHLVMRSEEDLRNALGNDFASRVVAAEPGRWFGPVPSARGVHLIFIENRTVGGKPAFAKVRNAVYAAWALEQQRSSRQKLLEQLRRSYPVKVEPGAVERASLSKAGP